MLVRLSVNPQNCLNGDAAAPAAPETLIGSGGMGINPSPNPVVYLHWSRHNEGVAVWIYIVSQFISSIVELAAIKVNVNSWGERSHYSCG